MVVARTSRTSRTRVRFPPAPRALDSGSSVVGAVRGPFVPSEDLSRPPHGIRHSDTARLWSHPELEILRAIVVLHAVEVMDRLLGEQEPPDFLLHDKDVLEYVGAARAGSRMTRGATHHVPRLVKGRTTAPVAVGFTGCRLARPTGGRCRLLGVPTRAEVVRRLSPTRRTEKMSTRRFERSIAALTPLHPTQCIELVFVSSPRC